MQRITTTLYRMPDDNTYRVALASLTRQEAEMVQAYADMLETARAAVEQDRNRERQRLAIMRAPEPRPMLRWDGELWSRTLASDPELALASVRSPSQQKEDIRTVDIPLEPARSVAANGRFSGLDLGEARVDSAARDCSDGIGSGGKDST